MPTAPCLSGSQSLNGTFCNRRVHTLFYWPMLQWYFKHSHQAHEGVVLSTGAGKLPGAFTQGGAWNKSVPPSLLVKYLNAR